MKLILFRIRRAIVVGLEDVCELTHRLPVQFWMCQRLALWSSELDAQWNTGVWHPIDGEET